MVAVVPVNRGSCCDAEAHWLTSPPQLDALIPVFAWELLLHVIDKDRYIAEPSEPVSIRATDQSRYLMARQCEACGKKVQMGNRVETRGKAKYLGGVGTKITGITRRKFVPNLQKVHVTLPNGQNTSMRVCTQCIRSGVVRKTVKTKPFDVSGGKK